ncbi:hypothetical protein L1987_64826 [Smallanthus sonchifolius]|uniref:Uncharacterized protein n=1 Tax=Smallanthus sonchifolius TaxID=185202 RepID=A0ACB9BSQ9_9ASTR|nr:hypothetical protein L1987_64826 [Smallanthus sonchifolius]
MTLTLPAHLADVPVGDSMQTVSESSGRLEAMLLEAKGSWAEAEKAYTSILEDNALEQLVQNGKRVVMMGDDTWTQMFPHHFNKSYPYSSFNVKDLDTVTLNYYFIVFLVMKLIFDANILLQKVVDALQSQSDAN